MNTDSLEVKLGDFSRDDLSPGTKLALHLCLGSTCWDMFLNRIIVNEGREWWRCSFRVSFSFYIRTSDSCQTTLLFDV